MQFSFIVALTIAIALSLALIQDVTAAPTRKRSSLNRVAKRGGSIRQKNVRVNKRTGPVPYYSLPPPPAPPVCPDPKDPRCPPVQAPLPPAPPPPPQGVAVPGFSLPTFPDLATSTAGLGTAPALPDPAGIVGGLITTEAQSVGAIVPGIMGGVTSLTQLGGGQQDD